MKTFIFLTKQDGNGLQAYKCQEGSTKTNREINEVFKNLELEYVSKYILHLEPI